MKEGPVNQNGSVTITIKFDNILKKSYPFLKYYIVLLNNINKKYYIETNFYIINFLINNN